MVMAMLAAGGIRPVAGSAAGSHELKNFGSLPALLADDNGREAVKVLDLIGSARLPVGEWRFVWIDRSPMEQALSTVKFLTVIGGEEFSEEQFDLTINRLAWSYRRDRPAVLGAYRKAGPVLELEFERVLAQPRKAAKRLARLVGGDFDVDAAAAVVHRRVSGCLPDCSVEEALTGG